MPKYESRFFSNLQKFPPEKSKVAKIFGLSFVRRAKRDLKPSGCLKIKPFITTNEAEILFVLGTYTCPDLQGAEYDQNVVEQNG